MARRLTIKTARRPVIIIGRPALHERKLVYIACANKLLGYPRGRSRIVYIGTTQNGVGRIAASAARVAKRFLHLHGVRSLELFVTTCGGRQRVQSWCKLERGLLLAFKQEFGTVPVGNTQGKNAFWRDEAAYFKPSRLRKVVLQYSAPRVSRRTDHGSPGMRLSN